MVIIRPPGWSERSELSNIWPLMPSRIMWNRLLGVERTVSAAESTKLRTHFQKPELPATKTNYNRAKVKLLPRIRNTATECFPGRVANDKIGASLGESSQRVPPTASERGVHVFFAGPRQVMAKSITKDIVQCLPNNSKLTCRLCTVPFAAWVTATSSKYIIARCLGPGHYLGATTQKLYHE